MFPRLAFLMILLTVSGVAQDYEFLGDYRSHKLERNRLTVETSNRPLTVWFHQPSTLRVLVGSSSPSYSVSGSLPEGKVSLKETATTLVARFPQGTLTVTKSPLRMTVTRSDGSLVVADDPAFGHGWDGREVRCWKQLSPEEKFFGLGEKAGDLDKRGRFWTMWNTDRPGYQNDDDPLYCSIPFFLAMKEGQAYGLFFDNTYRSTFNLGAGNERLYSFGAEAGALDYYLFLGPKPAQVLDAYTRLTGRPALAPKWALGYQQCRWSYYPDYEIRDLARNFRQRQIPADVLYFDIHYMDAYKVFTWHPERFPKPRQLLAELKELGFKVITIIDPGVKVETGYRLHDEGVAQDSFLKYLDGKLYQGQVWPGWCYFPDFRKAATRAWWGSHNAILRGQGVAGFWNDMNEPAVWGKEVPYVVEGIKELHNVFGLLMARATYEGLVKDQPDLRPFIVTRAAYAGIQKYAAVWTGDNSASWDDLRLSLRMVQGLGVSGVPFVGPDLGGFIGRPDPELYLRWMQAASLLPFMRSHTIINSPDQEPWSFGEETERLCREAIEARYALLPYLYSELHWAHRSGEPLIRPLWYQYPDDPESYKTDYQHQFMVGANILAAPVVRENQRFQKVYLPAGEWWDGESVHQGQRTVLVEAPLERLPLFYPRGALVVRRQPTQWVDQVPLTQLEVLAVAGGAGDYTCYLDDGVSTKRANELKLRLSGDRLDWSLDSPTSLTKLEIQVAGLAQRPGQVTLDGRTINFSYQDGVMRASVPVTSSSLVWR